MSLPPNEDNESAGLDEQAQVRLLEGLLRKFSPTLHEAPAVEYLAGQMEALGFAVQIDETGSLHGCLGRGPREIVLLGHIDTVPGEVEVRLEDDRLYGRGAVDAKGPLACFTAAAAWVGAQPGWRLTVIGATGEEGDSRGAKSIRDRYLRARRPDYCIIGEPSSWDHITLGYKGSAWVEYSVSRSLAHSAAQATSACETAVQFWNQLQAEKEAFNAGRARAFDQLTSSLRKMNTSGDGFTETAWLQFNLRLPPELDLGGVTQMLTRLAGDGELRLMDGIECFRGEKNTPLVRAFLAAIRQQGGKPGFLVKTGTSDMNLVGPAWGCPILAYGPGDSNLDHTPGEHVSLSEYLAGVRVLRAVLQNLVRES